MRVGKETLSWSTDQITYANAAAPGGDLSNATLYSEPFPIRHMEGFSFVVVATGAPVGTFKLQVANTDPKIPPAGIVDATVMNWVDVANAAKPISGAENFAWSMPIAYYAYARIVWTKTSGTGNATAEAFAKGSA